MGKEVERTIVAKLRDEMSPVFEKIKRAGDKVRKSLKGVVQETAKTEKEAKQAGNAFQRMGAKGKSAMQAISRGGKRAATSMKATTTATSQANKAMDSLKAGIAGAFTIGAIVQLITKIDELISKAQALNTELARAANLGGLSPGKAEAFKQALPDAQSDFRSTLGRSAEDADRLRAQIGELVGSGTVELEEGEGNQRRQLLQLFKLLDVADSVGDISAELPKIIEQVKKSGDSFEEVLTGLAGTARLTKTSIQEVQELVDAVTEASDGAVSGTRAIGVVSEALQAGLGREALLAALPGALDEGQLEELEKKKSIGDLSGVEDTKLDQLLADIHTLTEIQKESTGGLTKERSEFFTAGLVRGQDDRGIVDTYTQGYARGQREAEQQGFGGTSSALGGLGFSAVARDETIEGERLLEAQEQGDRVIVSTMEDVLHELESQGASQVDILTRQIEVLRQLQREGAGTVLPERAQIRLDFLEPFLERLEATVAAGIARGSQEAATATADGQAEQEARRGGRARAEQGTPMIVR